MRGSAVGGALAVLGGGRDQSRLYQRRQDRGSGGGSRRYRQPRGGQEFHHLHHRQCGQHQRRGKARTRHRLAAAGQRRFRRHQHQPDHQGRAQPAGEIQR